MYLHTYLQTFLNKTFYKTFHHNFNPLTFKFRTLYILFLFLHCWINWPKFDQIGFQSDQWNATPPSITIDQMK